MGVTKPAAAIAACSISLAAMAFQPTSDSPLAPPSNGPASRTPTGHIIANATIHTAPGETIERGQVTIKNGQIEWVGSLSGMTVAQPGYQIHEAEGLHVYPGFIDAFVEVDTPAADANAPGAHWNSRVTPQRDVLAGDGLTAGDAESLRKLGFTAAALHVDSGIFRGRGAVVSTAEPFGDSSLGTPPVYRTDAFMTMAFERTGWGSTEYPGSHMGAVALIRQTIMDAANRKASGASDASCLDFIDPAARTTYIDTDNDLLAMNADKVWGELGLGNLVLIGSGREYRRLDSIVGGGHPIVLPLAFTDKPDVKSVGAAESVDVSALMAWEQAPTNARRLADAGVDISITASKLPNGQKFWANMRKAIDEGGLTESQALAMITTNPAELLGVSDTLGTIAGGKVASLVVTDKPIFAEGAKILDVWVDGRRHEISKPKNTTLDGRWSAIAGGDEIGVLTIDGKSITFKDDTDETKGREATIDNGTFSFVLDDKDTKEIYVVSGVISDGRIFGTGIDPNGNAFQWSGVPAADEPEEEADEDEVAEADEGEGEDDADEPEIAEADEADDVIPDLPGYPFGAYAVSETPAQQSTIFINVTIWTSADAGIIENGWMVVEDGKVARIGEGTPPSAGVGTAMIDLKGKHVTPGLIDAHSHTGVFQLGVNEGTQAVTSEVRIEDALDPGHINWYRQLAGGVTTANIMHGSANPIGGQTLIVKNRWGSADPRDMYMDGATPGIKFALGENVKQSHWGEDSTTRYPQTRLGVETLMRDRFSAAREYLDRGMTTETGRRDLELEALAEILAGERFIQCHSYRQDEILMLCRIAGEFGFTIGAFQHGLETYKVAEVVKQHAKGASIFSDWWAYKPEVQDSIAYSGPINHEAGLLTSFNSDSDELSRRMNLEAAKALKYSRQSGIEMTPAEALNFVTINAAIMLSIDDRVGSLEVGKDADFVIWSADPLSAFTKCEATWIDGREYFSLAQDAKHREATADERKRLIAKALAKKDDPKPDADEAEGEGGRRRGGRRGRNRPDDEQIEALYQQYLTSGAQPGECGCGAIHELLHQMND